jgi:hypothetical protein
VFEMLQQWWHDLTGPPEPPRRRDTTPLPSLPQGEPPEPPVGDYQSAALMTEAAQRLRETRARVLALEAEAKTMARRK